MPDCMNSPSILPMLDSAVHIASSSGGAVAATDIDTSIDQVDVLPRDSPAWMDSLPDPFRPGDYDLRAIAYAFFASVLVLPSLLVVWTRLTGFEVDPRIVPAPTED